ncbi:zinc ribbon domain-containing protein [Clostridium brassicae]|uniref:Zinc ribbon domain-containing protein n=1 Tax=Clostridium brassicae TaxID=2999072 RepID=A0ABT4DFF0_9CLOT|nr:zinc ribbon domain-containing protein [Clostridium brassicae]MCY6959836.1 zinc ribbon domain-containing protein [Clostridium brassicae]
MFFIGIFGVDNKQKEIKVLNNVHCRNCDKGLGGKLIKTFNFFHFFFIPLFRWNEKYYVLCSSCNSIYEINKEKGKRIERGEDVEVTYWDLKPIETESNKEDYLVETRCKHCGEVVEPKFEYCPYCGTKIK